MDDYELCCEYEVGASTVSIERRGEQVLWTVGDGELEYTLRMPLPDALFLMAKFASACSDANEWAHAWVERIGQTNYDLLK